MMKTVSALLMGLCWLSLGQPAFSQARVVDENDKANEFEVALPYKGRWGVGRDKLLKSDGGNSESEAAVARGLTWLARQQQKDGYWQFDGNNKTQRVAATCLALLPFLAVNETPSNQGKYKRLVENGLTWLVAQAQKDGKFSDDMDEHALACLCLCELLGLQKDDAVREVATKAIGYLVNAQTKEGCWIKSADVKKPQPVYTWQLQALEAARWAKIKYDREAVTGKLEKYLDSITLDKGGLYHNGDEKTDPTQTATALLTRYHLGWFQRHPAFARGIEFLRQSPPSATNLDFNYFYHATRVFKNNYGAEWHKTWNPKMRDLLITLQNKGNDEALRGSWDKDSGTIGKNDGRLGTTCYAILTLQVYYRHLPLYKRDNAGLAELER